jgi:hypothetical protein
MLEADPSSGPPRLRLVPVGPEFFGENIKPKHILEIVLRNPSITLEQLQTYVKRRWELPVDACLDYFNTLDLAEEEEGSDTGEERPMINTSGHTLTFDQEFRDFLKYQPGMKTETGKCAHLSGLHEVSTVERDGRVVAIRDCIWTVIDFQIDSFATRVDDDICLICITAGARVVDVDWHKIQD